MVFIIFLVLRASGTCQNIAEMLGHPKDSKLLIMHADDLGVAHSVNESSISALENGGISSSSIMVPCPWFKEIAEYASKHPENCWGLHLTLTAEWKFYKWGGVASKNQTTSLLNEQGYFYDNVPEFVENAKLSEVYIELKAQIEKALRAGINVSHLDSHMGALFTSAEMFKIYVLLGKEYNLPVMVPGKLLPPSWNLDSLKGPMQYSLDQLVMMDKPEKDWEAVYTGMMDKLIPGLNQIIVHLAYDNDEMKGIMIDHPSFGSEWRQKDYNFVMSKAFKNKLQEEKIILVSWLQVKNALMKR